MFQAGVPKKIIKEITGHRSDALDKYAMTSEEQKEYASNVLAGSHKSNTSNNSNENTSGESIQVCVKGQTDEASKSLLCDCKKNTSTIEDKGQIVDLVQSLMTARKGEKAKLK